ncbi:MAG: TadE/TadG family type IV pilus assembly protein [Pseudomonadota bacterium]
MNRQPKTITTISELLTRFVSDRCGGVSSVEFALIGPVFLALIFSILELGLTMLKMSLLDFAVADAAKLVYVGTPPTQSELEDFICDKARFFSACKENITVELTPISGFEDPPSSDAPCKDGDDVDQIAPAVTYNAGGANSIMYMRVCITTNIVTPGLGLGVNLVKTGTSRAQVISQVAFMNEPFTASPGTSSPGT